MKRRSLVIITVCAILLPVGFVPWCFAADPAQPSAIGAAVKDLIDNTIMPLLIALVGSLVGVVLLKIRTKLNLNISRDTEAWLGKQAENAVQLVAEKAAATLKYDAMKVTGKEKLDMAIAALITKAPDLTREQADAYIHAALARISGEGATGDKAVRS